jgi:hypothetical protein
MVPPADDRKGTDVVISLPHYVGDGPSLISLCEELLHHYSMLDRDSGVDASAEHLPLIPDEDEMVRLGPVDRIRSIWSVARSITSDVLHRPRVLPITPHLFKHSSNRAMFRTVAASGLRARCRANGTTVGSTIYAACLKAAAALVASSPADLVRIIGAATISLRSYVEPAIDRSQIGNVSGIHIDRVRLAPGADLWSLARQLKQNQRQTDRRQLWAPRILSAVFAKAIAKRGKPPIPFMICMTSNLGVFDPRFTSAAQGSGPRVEEVYSLPPTVPHPIAHCQAILVGERLCLSFCYSHPAMSAERVQMLADGVTQILIEACGASWERGASAAQ